MQSLGKLLDVAAVKAKNSKLYDISVINDVLQETEADRWPGVLSAQKVIGSEGNRTLIIRCDSATALLISHDLSGILGRINALLGSLAVEKIRVDHHH